MSIRACIDRVIPPQFRQEAARAAAGEHPLNLPSGIVPELAVEHKKLWKPGRTLRVRFLEGQPAIQRRVAGVAQTWSRHANVRLEFVNTGDAEIRIAFQDDGSWSAVGTDALVASYFAKSDPTMNYGWLTADSTDAE